MVVSFLYILQYTIKLSQVRIGVDLDGVVANFTEGWTSQYKKDFGKKILDSEITDWGLAKPLTHFDKEIDFWNWAKDINGSSIFRHLKTYKNSVETLRELAFAGYEIIILSSKPWWAVHDTLMWIGENKIPSKEIHFIEDKWNVECDVYIDDAPHQLESFVKHAPEKLILRFVREYNRPVQGTLDLHNWLELTSLLENHNL